MSSALRLRVLPPIRSELPRTLDLLSNGKGVELPPGVKQCMVASLGSAGIAMGSDELAFDDRAIFT